MLGSVRYIALAKKYKPLLDKSVPEIHADQLRKGTFNGTSYTGKNVILGFVDTASIGSTSISVRRRYNEVKNSLDMGPNGHGSHPTGFTYGASTLSCRS